MAKLTRRQVEFLKALAQKGGKGKVWKITLSSELLPRSAKYSEKWRGHFLLRVASQLVEKGLVRLYKEGQRGWEVELTQKGWEIV